MATLYLLDPDSKRMHTPIAPAYKMTPSKFTLITALILFSTFQSSRANLIGNADFATGRAGWAGWAESGSKGAYQVLPDQHAIQFTPPPTPANSHLDYILELAPDTFYLASVQVRATGIHEKPSRIFPGP